MINLQIDEPRMGPARREREIARIYAEAAAPFQVGASRDERGHLLLTLVVGDRIESTSINIELIDECNRGYLDFIIPEMARRHIWKLSHE